MGLGLRAIIGAYVGKKLSRWLGVKVREGTTRRAKWPFIVIPLLYFILPDFIPLPIDDLLVALVSFIWYSITEPKTGKDTSGPTRRGKKDVIDIEGKVVDE
jgi:hypothetical protein